MVRIQYYPLEGGILFPYLFANKALLVTCVCIKVGSRDKNQTLLAKEARMHDINKPSNHRIN